MMPVNILRDILYKYKKIYVIYKLNNLTLPILNKNY